MNRTFDPSTDLSPSALEAVVRQAHADRSAFIATILIGFGKKIKELVAGAERGAAAGRRHLRGSAA